MDRGSSRLMTRSLNDRVNELLADLAHACVSSSQHKPADGSVLLAETASDNTVGSAALPHPYGFAHTALRGLVYSAGERVESTRLLSHRDPPHILSLHDTARAAAEAGATAAWLGHPKADGHRRLERLVHLIEESSQYESQLRTALGLAGNSMYQDMLAWAHESGIAPEKATLTERVRQAAADRGRADYKRLTNVTHNTLWAVVAGWHEVTAAQHGNIGPIWAHALLASLAVSPYVLAGIAAADRTAGRVDSRHHELAQRAINLEDEARAFTATVVWPDSKNPWRV